MGSRVTGTGTDTPPPTPWAPVVVFLCGGVALLLHVRAARLSTLEFSVAVAALCTAAALLLMCCQPRPMSRAQVEERFLVGQLKGILDDTIVPSLERMAATYSGEQTDEERAIEALLETEEGGEDLIELDHWGDKVPEEEAQARLLRYKRAGYFLCALRRLDKPGHDRLMKALGSAPMQTPQEEPPTSASREPEAEADE
jgi:hypothetical protein